MRNIMKFNKKIFAVVFSILLILQTTVLTQATITESQLNIASFKIAPITLSCEPTYGGIQYRFNKETNEYISYNSYFLPAFEYDILLFDGTKISGITDIDHSFEYNGRRYQFSYTIGGCAPGNSYTIEVTLLDITSELLITVEESPIESIEVSPVHTIEGTHCRIANGYDFESGEYKDYFCYNLWECDIKGIVKFKDGTTASFTGYSSSIEYNGAHYSIRFLDNQSYNEPWTAGNTYYGGVNIAGISATFPVKILEVPVEKIVFDEIKIIEKTSGYYNTYYDNEIGEYIEYYNYDFMPSFIVYFKDGTYANSEFDTSVWPSTPYVIYNKGDYNFNDLNYLNYYNEIPNLKIGKNTIECSLLGYNTSFTVEILESPIEKIVVDSIELKENFDGNYSQRYNVNTEEYEKYFNYDYIPTVTAYFKDGTMQKSEGRYLDYNGESYWVECIDNQYESPWNIGENKTKVQVLGAEAECTVKITDNPYVDLQISGTDEIVITLTKSNGETEVMHAKTFIPNRGDQGLVGGTLITDKSTFANVTFNYYAPDYSYFDYSKDVSLKIGNLTSNTLESCNWLKFFTAIDECRLAIIHVFRNCYSEVLYGKPFNSFDGTLTEENIDAIIAMALNYSAGTYDYEDEDGLINLDTAREKVEEIFGFTDIDFTKSSFYNLEENKLDVLNFIDEMAYYHDIQFKEQIFENNEHINTYSPSKFYKSGKWVKAEYDIMKITLNENLKITGIEFANNPVFECGDTNKDGKVNAKDLVTMKKNLLLDAIENRYKTTYDINMDKKINILDFIGLVKNISK